MKVRFGAHTDTGRVRDHNEDTLLARPPVFAVADGMGGHEAGEVASSLAVATVESADLDAADPENWVGHVVDSANTAVFAKGAQRGGALRMGTTLTVAYTAPDAIYLGHVGDSRAYMLHDGRLRQLTDDHSLVAEWVRQGRITAEEAAVHPQRSVITRARHRRRRRDRHDARGPRRRRPPAALLRRAHGMRVRRGHRSDPARRGGSRRRRAS